MQAQIRSATDPAQIGCQFCGWFHSSRESFLVCKRGKWAPSREGAPYRRTAVVLAGENSGDVLDRSANVVGKQRDRTDHGERDHGENNAVLRHRLAVLAVAERVGSDLHEGEELQHLCHLLPLIDAHAVAREFPEGKTGTERSAWC